MGTKARWEDSKAGKLECDDWRGKRKKKVGNGREKSENIGGNV